MNALAFTANALAVDVMRDDQEALEWLHEIISELPGGEYIKDHWKHEPLEVAGIDGEEFGALVNILERIFPFACQEKKEHRQLVLLVPRTIVKLMQMRTLTRNASSGDDTYVHLLQVAPHLKEKLTTQKGIDALSKLWTSQHYHYTLQEAAERYEALLNEAVYSKVEEEILLETSLGLWEDRDNDYGEYLELAALTFQ